MGIQSTNNWFIGLLLALIPVICLGVEDMEAFFSKTPAELSEMTATIASGTPKPVFRSAGSISVITEDQFKTMGATELTEVLETIPGVHVTLDTLAQDPTLSIRGLTNENNAQILMLLNGTRITTPFHSSMDFGPSLPLAAVKRIEVIRGPGSSVYGADAFAGVINIITKKADDMKGGQLGVRAGNWNSQSGWGQYGNHWQGWDIAANIQYQGTDGDSGRIIGADYQTQIDRQFGTNASRAPRAMDTKLRTINTHVNLHRKYLDVGFWGYNILDSGTRAGSSGNIDPSGKAHGDQYLGDIRVSTEDLLDKWEFQGHFSFLNTTVSADFRNFPAFARLPIGKNGDIDFRPNPNPLTTFLEGTIENLYYTQKIPNVEITSIYTGFNDHQIRLGGGYRHENIQVNRHLTNYGRGTINGLNPPTFVGGKLKDVTGTPFSFLEENHRTIWSALLQDEWQISDSLTLTSGLRYDHYSDFGSTVNPRAALVWDINPKLTSKLMYGRAFRAPNFYELGLQNNPNLQNNAALKPETINTGELAFDYRPYSTLRTALNLFYYRLEDCIVPVQNDNVGLQYQNFGEQEGYGTEAEMNWQLSEQWNLSGNYAWQHSRNPITGLKTTGVPEHQIYVAANWRFLPQWQFQTQLNWIGNRIRPAGDAKPLNDYQSVDFTLRGNQLWGHVNFAASLRNAFDNNNFELSRLPGHPSNFPLPGRSFYLETSIDF